MLGALVSKTEDISKSATPVTMVFVVSFIITMTGMNESDMLLMKVASFIPFTPECHVCRGLHWAAFPLWSGGFRSASGGNGGFPGLAGSKDLPFRDTDVRKSDQIYTGIEKTPGAVSITSREDNDLRQETGQGRSRGPSDGRFSERRHCLFFSLYASRRSSKVRYPT